MKLALVEKKKSQQAITFDCPECAAEMARGKTVERHDPELGCHYVAGPGKFCPRHAYLAEHPAAKKERA